MGNDHKGKTSHSAEYFGDTRDYWWNQDYLDLLAHRWKLDQVSTVLDVGCGVGHWGRLLARVLPADAHITGIDREAVWVVKASDHATKNGLQDRFAYRVGLAEDLPYDNDVFDLVTCQTVLIHAHRPETTLDEMIRVTRPGGLVAVAEPNNIASALVFDRERFDAPIAELVDLVRFQLTCERGKASLGEGNNSVGELIPALFAERGLEDIRVAINDRASAVTPPYNSPDERAIIEEAGDSSAREFWIWNRGDTARYFVAGGGGNDFDALWTLATKDRSRVAAAIRAGTYATAGGALCYVVSGRKPRR